MGLLDVCAIRWARSRAYLRAEAPSIITAVPHQKCADFCDPNRSSSFPLASSTVRQTPLPPLRYPRTTMLTTIQARMSSSYSPTPARRGTKSATGFSAHSTDEKQIRHPRLQRDLEQHRCRRCRPFPPCICSMCTTDSFCTQLEAARDSKAPIMYDTRSRATPKSMVVERKLTHHEPANISGRRRLLRRQGN